MKKRYHLIAAAAVALTMVVLSGGAYATHGGLHGLFNSRGTIEPFRIRDNSTGLRVRAREPIDVAVVGAQLDPGAQTGWHSHPVDSIVTVQPGGPALRMLSVSRGRCVQQTFAAGTAFVHPDGVHNFINTSNTAPLTFGVAYMVPVGATLLTNMPPPEACT